MSTRKVPKKFSDRGRKTSQRSKPELLPSIRKIGYARVSTAEQNLQMQIDALLREGVHPDNLHVEKVSGVSARRPKLELALMDARAGDTFYVWKLDRLGRNVVDLYGKVELLAKNGVGFRSIMDQFDTSTAMGKAMFGMMAVFAQFERDQTIERTKRGLQAARERGYKPGAKRTIDVDKVAKRIAKGETVSGIAKDLGVVPNTIRRYFTAADIEKLQRKR